MNATDGGGADLLAPLREMDIDDSPPPGYDVAGAMRRAGTIRRRRIATGVIAVALLGAVAVPAILRQAPGGRSTAAGRGAFPVADCTGRAIAAPAGAGAYTSVAQVAIDATGRYLTLTLARPDVRHDGATRVALQDRRTGTITMIPVDNGFAVAVNSSGTVLGWVQGRTTTSAWLYEAGRVITLPLYKGEPVVPTAINSRGDAVGYANDEHVTGVTDGYTAVIWPAGSPRTVRALDGSGSMANSIGDDGTVGGSRNVLGLAAPAVWNAAGTARMLPTGDVGRSGSVQSVAGDYAAGEAQFAPVPVVWNLATGRMRFYPKNLAIWWVSSDGTAVGGLTTSAYNNVGAVIARGGNVWRLPDINRLDGQFATGATADAKTIIGAAYSGADEYALIWAC